MGLPDRTSKNDEGASAELKERSTILAYLEELARLRTHLQVRLKEGDSSMVGARIDLVSEETLRFSVAFQKGLPEGLKPRQAMEIVFSLDGMRFAAPTTFLKGEDANRASFSIPDLVRHAERRKQPRAKHAPREKASAIILEGLFEGKGVSGRILNMSAEGICIILERAIAIQGEKKLPITSNLFQRGQKLAIVRLQELPQTPMIECSGLVSHMGDSQEGVRLGIQLQGVEAASSQLLQGILTRRVPSATKSFPVRRRLSEREATNPKERSDIAEPAATGALRAPDERKADAEIADPGLSPEAYKMRRMKGNKRILLVLLDDLDRAIVSGTLQVDGYRAVREARNFVEATECFRKGGVDLMLVDQQIGAHPAQVFLERLRKTVACEGVPVVMFSDTTDVRTTIMARAARIAHVSKKPVDYDGELKAVMERLLKLA